MHNQDPPLPKLTAGREIYNQTNGRLVMFQDDNRQQLADLQCYRNPTTGAAFTLSDLNEIFGGPSID
jgi:hypothetical protein